MTKNIGINILLYPEFLTQDKATDILNRISWGLINYNKRIKIYYISELSLIYEQISKTYSSVNTGNYLLDNSNIKLEKINLNWLLSETVKEFDLILVWDTSKLSEIVAKNSRTIIIDPYSEHSTEADNIASLQYSLLNEDEKAELIANNTEIFQNLYKRFKNKTIASLFLTGPSLDSVLQKKISSNGIKIVCNSIVKNQSLMEKIDPDILMFSDPAYHFGPSKYSESFRRYIHECFQKFKDLICIVPERYLPLISSYYDTCYRDHFLGIPVVDQNEFNFPRPNKLFVRYTGNILTQFMIPVASTLTNVVEIFGADGRAPTDKGFWNHSAKSQMHDLESSIYKTHPSLARDTNVKEYYKNHCEMLENILRFGEQKGIKYHSKTKSFIPALNNRQKIEIPGN